jgi:hypothetical protein
LRLQASERHALGFFDLCSTQRAIRFEQAGFAKPGDDRALNIAEREGRIAVTGPLKAKLQKLDLAR